MPGAGKGVSAVHSVIHAERYVPHRPERNYDWQLLIFHFPRHSIGLRHCRKRAMSFYKLAYALYLKDMHLSKQSLFPAVLLEKANKKLWDKNN